jgi:hypothetical protein
MEQTNQPDESAAIMRVIARESEEFWNKDYDAWAQCWLHAPYVRVVGWWARGGVTVIEGFDVLGNRMKENMRTNPEPNPTASQVRRENINLRIAQDMAWVTFDQHGQDTGEPDMDMPGVSRETRILEKHNGEWKIVYAGWLLEGEA